ncbi:hypothetical protein ACE1SV_73650 [Streptomyces sennicomposti]
MLAAAGVALTGAMTVSAAPARARPARTTGGGRGRRGVVSGNHLPVVERLVPLQQSGLLLLLQQRRLERLEGPYNPIWS